MVPTLYPDGKGKFYWDITKKEATKTYKTHPQAIIGGLTPLSPSYAFKGGLH